MASKIRLNDSVIFLSGKDKGKVGKIKKIFSNKRRAIVEGLNLVKKHQKPVPSLNQVGGIILKEASVDLSNLAIYNTRTKKKDKVGFRFEDGKKVRFFKSDFRIIK